MVFFVDSLQFFVLRCKAALCCGVNDEDNLVGILSQRHFATFSVFNGEIVYCFHFQIMCLMLFNLAPFSASTKITIIIETAL